MLSSRSLFNPAGNSSFSHRAAQHRLFRYTRGRTSSSHFATSARRLGLVKHDESDKLAQEGSGMDFADTDRQSLNHSQLDQDSTNVGESDNLERPVPGSVGKEGATTTSNERRQVAEKLSVENRMDGCREGDRGNKSRVGEVKNEEQQDGQAVSENQSRIAPLIQWIPMGTTIQRSLKQHLHRKIPLEQVKWVDYDGKKREGDQIGDLIKDSIIPQTPEFDTLATMRARRLAKLRREAEEKRKTPSIAGLQTVRERLARERSLALPGGEQTKKENQNDTTSNGMRKSLDALSTRMSQVKPDAIQESEGVPAVQKILDFVFELPDSPAEVPRFDGRVAKPWIHITPGDVSNWKNQYHRRRQYSEQISRLKSAIAGSDVETAITTVIESEPYSIYTISNFSAVGLDLLGKIFDETEPEKAPEKAIALLSHLHLLHAARPSHFGFVLTKLLTLKRPDLIRQVFRQATLYAPEYCHLDESCRAREQSGFDEFTPKSTRIFRFNPLDPNRSQPNEALWVFLYISFVYLQSEGLEYRNMFLRHFDERLLGLRRPNHKLVSSVLERHAPEMDPEHRKHLVNLCVKREEWLAFQNPPLLHRLLEKQVELERAEAIERLYRSGTSTLRFRASITGAFYDAFIFAFMSLKKRERAVEVWNDMVNNGYSPTIHSWNALLCGCGLARDIPSLNAVWSRMVESGVTPDGMCWTTRIHGLLRSGHLREGMQALTEMTHTVMVPPIETINSVVDQLSKAGYIKDALSVLRSSLEAGVRPDNYTYNSLLVGLLKHRDFEGALTVLKTMTEEGIPPNVITYTAILYAVTRSVEIDTSSDDILRYLAKMHNVGVLPNVVTFTSALHALLGKGETEKAEDVLAMMRGSSVRPNRITYTVLICFFAKHNEFETVQRLWDEMDMRGIEPDLLSLQFTIEEYARYFPCSTDGVPSAGTIQILKFVRKMHDLEMSPNMGTYNIVLKRLVKEDLKAAAWKLVKQLFDHRGRRNYRSQAEEEFWTLVDELNNVGWWRDVVGDNAREVSMITPRMAEDYRDLYHQMKGVSVRRDSELPGPESNSRENPWLSASKEEDEFISESQEEREKVKDSQDPSGLQEKPEKVERAIGVPPIRKMSSEPRIRGERAGPDLVKGSLTLGRH